MDTFLLYGSVPYSSPCSVYPHVCLSTLRIVPRCVDIMSLTIDGGSPISTSHSFPRSHPVSNVVALSYGMYSWYCRNYCLGCTSVVQQEPHEFGSFLDTVRQNNRSFTSFDRNAKWWDRITTTIIAPTPLVAANFIIVEKLINRIGPKFSRLSGKWCKFRFLFFVISLDSRSNALAVFW